MCCDKLATTQYFLNNVLWRKKIRWQIHATIGLELEKHHRRMNNHIKKHVYMYIYTVSNKRCHYIFVHNFSKC